MAKIRRVVRKVAPASTHDVFDEALWPTYVALVVLGGFLMGVSAAYLKFSNTPWFANAITWLILIPTLIGGLMFGFRFFDNRVLRRSMQFSAIIAAIIHLILVVQLKETNLFSQIFRPTTSSEEKIERRELKKLPEYHLPQLVPDHQRPTQDHEKPVETETPDITPEELTKRETEPEKAQPTAQPVPVPETETVAKVDPNVVQKKEPNETNPRQDETPSKLSRQQTPTQVKISQQVDVPREAPQAKPTLETKPIEAVVQRQQTNNDTPRRAPEAEATAQTPQAIPQIAKTTPQKAPQAESTAQPTLQRTEAQPLKTPVTQVASADAPAVSKQTAPEALVPRNTEATKQVTASTENIKTANETIAQATTNPTAAKQERKQESEVRPQVAQSATETPSRQARVTERPEVATSAKQVGPAPGTDVLSSQLILSPQQSRVEKTAAAATPAAQPATTPAAEPTVPNSQQAAAKIAKVEGAQAPTPTTNPTQVASATPKTGTTAAIAAATQAAAVAAAPTTTPTTGDVAATSSAVRRQQTTAAETATRVGDPAPVQVASAATGAAPTAVRRAAADGSASSETPSVTQSANSPIPSPAKGSSNQLPNVVTTAANVATNSASNTSVNPQPGASAALVSRQSADNASGATRTQPSLEIAASGASMSIASPGAARSQVSSVPTIDAAAAPSNSPARAATNAQIAASPQAVDSPAVRVSEQGAGDPSAAPARMALNKGLAGTAGIGQSPNLDSSAPNSSSPAMVASNAARRTQATQEMARGDSLSPSSPAQLARSRAESAVPLSSLQAEAVQVATIGGTRETADTTASSSASLTRAAANAPAGSVTAAKGTGDVDLGPVTLVADTGTGRAAGGGQPILNFETKSGQIARSEAVGGASQVALAVPKIEAVAAAPSGDGGGQPKIDTPGPAAVAANRAVAGGTASASGGPSTAVDRGPLVEASTAALLADNNVSRADASGGAGGAAAAAGQPSIEDEEEKARRLARTAGGGAPQLALSAPTVAAIPTSPAGNPGAGGTPAANAQATAVATDVGRTAIEGGAPRGGAPLAAAEAPSTGSKGGGELVSSAVVMKAETASGAVGPAVIGGGTNAPQRAATGPTFAANVQATTVDLAGAPQSAGKPNGAPLEAQGSLVARSSGGAQGVAIDSRVGAVAGENVVVASAVGAAGQATGRRQVSAGEGTGPAVGDLVNKGGIGKQSATTSLPAGGGAVVEVPQMGTESAVVQASLDHMMGGMSKGTMSKQTGEALAVNIEAADGPGGLGAELTPRVGLNTRQARNDSVTVQIATSRFERQRTGGVLTVNTSAVLPTESFKRRNARTMGEDMGGGKGSPPPQTEDAIEAGLRFLARYQQPDGRWKLQGYGEETALQSDTAATALALLAFQGAGYHHKDHQYKDVIRKGVEFLVKNQKENGDLFVPLDDKSNASVWLYSHSIATLALCEAYGMTQDASLKEPAQKAVDFIVAGQHKERGGWRYSPGIGSDTSVTGWMMMALKSGELANLKVPKETYDKITAWLNVSQQSQTQPHMYRYNPYAPDTAEQRHGRVASKTMTSVGLLMRLYTGWKRDHVNMVAGANYLKENLPELGTVREPKRDSYYWYYGTQVMFHMGGDYWAAWNARLHPMLIESQQQDGPHAGSWNPRAPVVEAYGVQAGRLYVTTMNLLSLEVYYRHLPLYEDTAK